MPSRLRMQVMKSNRLQFCDVKDATQQGKGKGDVYHWDVFSNVATQGTTLTETNTMPESNFTISQGTLTITEAGNSVPYSGKLNDLSMLPVTEIINKVLKNDAAKAFDILAHAQFNLTPLTVQPTGGTDTSAVTVRTDSAFAASNTDTAAFNTEHAKSIVDAMKERNIPCLN